MTKHFERLNGHCRAALLGVALFIFIDFAFGASAKQEGRFLFVIETSAAMDADKATLRRCIRSIVDSSLNRQIQFNDTVGVWTYNDKLNTDFPMVIWSGEHAQDIYSAIDQWIGKLKFEHRADFSKVQPTLQRVINDSQKLTIIWISTGNDAISGTPFDSAIAELHKDFRDQFRKAHIPFVTLMAVRKGVVVDFTVNPGDADLRLPPILEKEAAEAHKPAVVTEAETEAPAPRPAPNPTKPPLIIRIGPSPELVQQKQTNTATPAPKVVAQTNVSTNVQTNAIAVEQKPQTNVAPPISVPPTIVQSNAVVTTNKLAQTNPVIVSSPAVSTTATVAAVVAPQPKPSNAPPAVVKSEASTTKPQPIEASVVDSIRLKLTLIAVGVGLLIVLAGVIVFLVKKSTATQGPSFISQSMTRERLNSGASKPSSDNPADPE